MIRIVALMVSLIGAGATLAQDCAPGGDTPAIPPSVEAETLCETHPRRGLWLSWTEGQVEICRTVPRSVLSRAIEDAACRCSSASADSAVFGDLLFMREAAKGRGLDPEFERRLAAAYLSQETTAARARLAPDLAGSPEHRALALAALAQIALRADSAEADNILVEARRAADAAGIALSDLDYLGAVRELARGHVDAARDSIDAALAAEPDFFNARFLGLIVSLRRWTRDGPRNCVATLEAIFDDLSALLALSPCPVHAAYIDATLSTMRHVPPDELPVALIRFALALNADNPVAVATARARLQESRASAPLSAECDAIVTREATALNAMRPDPAE